jgi:hypothetical protein
MTRQKPARSARHSPGAGLLGERDQFLLSLTAKAAVGSALTFATDGLRDVFSRERNGGRLACGAHDRAALERRRVA